ncbi:MAG: hypothetical protein ACRDYW_06840 [Acidimicrobiales bacterium]
MIELTLMGLFFGGLVVGGVIADAAGRLPTAEELAAQDQRRFARYERAVGNSPYPRPKGSNHARHQPT